MPNSPAIHAAEYIRMSSDVQDLSPAIQRQAISDYAQSNDIRLIATYVDEGRSGLAVKNRPAMKQLLKDVAEDGCPFSMVLVYDVSRWGRFEDTDASAYYEYHCRLNGVDVVYVQEPFVADKSPMSAVLKNLKRAMAAEYSRELAVKSRAGQTRSIELGYQMGLPPCIGFRREAVSREGVPKRILGPKERKPSPTDRVRWIPGPPDEVQLVRRIYSLYATTDITIKGLAELLDGEGLRASDGGALTAQRIGCLLHSEAVAGTFVWGRRDERSGTYREPSDPAITRQESSTLALVDHKTVAIVRWKRSRARGRRRSKSLLLDQLRAAVRADPGLSTVDLPAHGCATEGVYRKFFGSFVTAVRLAGRDDSLATAIQRQRQARGDRLAKSFTSDLGALLRSEHIVCAKLPRFRVLLLENRLHLAIDLVWRRNAAAGTLWYLKKLDRCECDFVLLVRMEQNETARDFLLLSAEQYRWHPPWFKDAIPSHITRLSCAGDLIRNLRALLNSHS